MPPAEAVRRDYGAGNKPDLLADQKFRPEIEVLSAVDAPRRQQWSDVGKIRIVEESFVGHRQVAATAQRHGVSRSPLTIWRRQYRDVELCDETSPAFIPLTLSPGTPVPTPVAQSGADDVQLEIVLSNGRRLFVPSTVDPEMLPGFFRCWRSDDRLPGGGTRLDRCRSDRHVARHEHPGSDCSAGSWARPACS
ncbi:IS66-like element accessory protein TnpA [Aliiruegeria haliotis]|uniref:IS66-like element accessory protein TnpA n=1 Tax=Aliiruegeria haliotis TaxID=1280846 RepID=UPI001FE28F63|nr:transposase [Aliiruegeria haliotis]